VLGIRDADHEETAPQSRHLVISKLVCSLAGRTETVTVAPGSLARRWYGKDEAAEQFRCNYGLNPEYSETLRRGELRVSGTGPDGEARIVELPGHRFYIATLFLPQLSSTPDQPHPLIVAFLRAAMDARSVE
jgi:CTP synthase (UTP-ammonia lyase)